ncbi:hypothetical protein [Microbacterium sp. SORGH_AS_0505]|uniref:hypothetical protein n=1 Tax=Microbacterium sp. SORGH_AS_0505 TaxID=3041770 RepID=UPI0027D9063A|nr:hypothetical protein [Microbacterium sp. SORGH_AS_0505]
MDEIESGEDVVAAFRAARLAAEEHMIAMDDAGSTWHETTITGIVLQHAHPTVKFVDFSQRQEGTTGADWLWWWVDESGEAFGMLVQAKRLKVGSRWTIDFSYPDGTSAQRDKLFASARELGVPPVYGLYLGTQAYRAPVTCGRADHDDSDCLACRMATVSLLPAILATVGGGMNSDNDAIWAVEHAIPFETLVDPAEQPDCAYDRNLALVDGELRDLLLANQHGARHVAKALFERVSSVRAMQFSAASELMIEGDSEQLFDRYPSDRGHLGVAYFEHILRGLRTAAPAYVLDVLADQSVPPSVADLVEGVVVVQL